jgi:NACHT domain
MEEWRDERFAELEAEVEFERSERMVRRLRLSPSRPLSLRREASLSRGLAKTTDTLVILEGEPGSGKSVALRHLAVRLARNAQKARSATSTIPLYVNLKEFRPLLHPIDGSAVRHFLLETLNRSNNRDVEQFLHNEFDQGARNGSWLLLLDSFDEIADIPGSAEASDRVEEYTLAINEFLSDMGNCRAIVASRAFRGPKTLQVPHFRILALTAKHQNDLVKRSGLHADQQRIVHEGLAGADSELQQMARNPMFLGLICEHVRNTGAFPASSLEAYDSYMEQRFTRDADRIRQRYGVGPNLVRAVAEETAFCMADTEGLGLSPSRAELRSIVAAQGRIPVRLLDNTFDALEYLNLGRYVDTPADGTPHFTFAHRRFQEYFATRAVLRSPERVSPTDLLTNIRWRETAEWLRQLDSRPL